MRISERLTAGGYSISFEVFPPKKESDWESVEGAIDEIAALTPSFMSVTYGAGGGTSRYTFETAERVEKRYGVPMLVHLTCLSSTKETLSAAISEIKSRGLVNVMALRGDRVEGVTASSPDFLHAADLIRELRKSCDGLCIGGACYPEVHPESPDQKTDIKYLKEKVEAGCDFLTTQMFFDNNLLFNFLYKIREAGIDVPVIPGIMPITNGRQVERAIKLSGSFMPQRFKTIVDRFGNDDRAMLQAGVAYATDQIIDLFANGIKHVHVYSMNKPEVAAAILRNLSDILGK